jgi:hypothetical protein
MSVKFDDIPKTASAVLNDDFVGAGYQFKAKQKTNFDGAVVTSTVDLFQTGKDTATCTPAKLTWKFPKPFGLAGLVIDKLEMDKAGKMKLEASMDKGLHKVDKLVVDVKSDLVDLNKATAGLTYTGIDKFQIKCETKPTNPADLVGEVTTSVLKGATLGLKFNMATQDAQLGIRYASGPLFAAVMAKDMMSTFSVFGYYKPCDPVKIACSYEIGGKKNGAANVGAEYVVDKSTKVKAKVNQDMAATCALKRDVAKGFTVSASIDSKMSYGFQLSIE